MNNKRSAYFSFQGLLTAILLLLFIYHRQGALDGDTRFWILSSLLISSLVWLRFISQEILSQWYFATGLFLGDAVVASLALIWSQPASDLYLIYFVIIFGTALTRKFIQSLAVACLTSFLYLFSAWSQSHGFPDETGFWLRFLFLWITAILLAILAQDTEETQRSEKRHYEERIVQVERLATLGQIAGEVAHRIKGPLTTIMVNAEVLSHKQKRTQEELKELREIQEEATHCKEILKDLLNLGRIEEINFAPLDLQKPIKQALHSIEAQAKKLKIAIETQGLSDPLPVLGDESLFQEALSAVLQNAVEALPKGGHIILNVQKLKQGFRWRQMRPYQEFWSITIEDDGKGIAVEHLEKIFQPFFTTKGPQGSGIGLSAALRILQKHNGTIAVHSNGPGQGARFTLTIPKAK